jgi:hypothetical protein
MEEKQKSLDETILGLKSLLNSTQEDLNVTRAVMVVNQKKLGDLPQIIEKLRTLSRSLEADKQKIKANLLAQQKELETLSPLLSKPSIPLRPTFIVTPSHRAHASYAVSSCPVCCFGYDNFNWIPASCGHAYHPSCLFQLISNSSPPPKCMSCANILSPDWLQMWGLKFTWEGLEDYQSKITNDMVTEMKQTYGQNAGRLQQRRDVGRKILQEQLKVFTSLANTLLPFCYVQLD